MEPFIFNKLMDPSVLSDLYENDYTYIENIFKTALDNLEGDLVSVQFCHTSGDLEGLRKAVHKIKPTFGFLGMLGIQEQCGLFEERCRSSKSTDELTNELNALMQLIEAGKKAIEEDHQKLITFNKTRS